MTRSMRCLGRGKWQAIRSVAVIFSLRQNQKGAIKSTMKKINAIHNVANKVVGLFGKKNYASGSFMMMTRFSAHKFRDFKSYLETLGKISSLSKSLDTINKYCQLASWGIYKGDKLIENPPIDLMRIIKNPNKWETLDSLKAYFVYDALLTGNPVWAKYGASLSTGKKPKSFQRLYPQYFKIKKDNVEKIEGYEYGRGFGASVEYDVNEIIHTKYMPNPLDEYFGMGVIQSNERLFGHAIDLNVIRDKFYDNGAILSGVIQLEKQMNKPERDLMQMDFDTKYSGRDNANKTMILANGAKYQQIGLSPSEMQSIEDLILTHREIFMMFGLPPFLRNLSADDNPKYDNIFQQEISFRQLAIAPMLKAFDAAMTQFVQDWYPDLEFRHEDVTDRVSPENVEKMITLGLINRDEGRVLMGQKATNKPAMKQILVPMNLMPIDALLGLTDPSLTAPGGKPENVKPEDEAAAANDATSDSQTAEEIARGERSIPRGRLRSKSWRDKNAGGWESRSKSGIWTIKELSDIENIARIQRDFMRLERASLRNRMAGAVSVYLNFLTEQTARVVDNLKAEKSFMPKHEKVSSGLLDRIFKDDVENALIVNVGTIFYTSLSDSAMGNVSDILGMDIAIEANAALASRVDLMRKTAPRMNKTTKLKLGKILNEGISEGITTQALAQRIQEGMEMYNSSRPLTIARNELAEAYRQGNRQAMQDADIITHISVVGCIAQEDNAPTYHGQCTCNITDVPIEDVDQLEYHVNHSGCEVPSRFGVIQ